jgi:cytochrome c oxidase assembly protein subunit 16
MPTFGSKKFRTSSYNNTLPARYRAALAKHPFALFGLPFVGTMLLGSFFLTPATALRYERHDRKVKTMTEEEKLGIGKDRRRVDMKEEYYVSACDLRPAMKIVVGNFAGECMTDYSGIAETRSQGSGQLGAETGQETAWRARRCVVRDLDETRC